MALKVAIKKHSHDVNDRRAGIVRANDRCASLTLIVVEVLLTNRRTTDSLLNRVY